MGKFQFKKNTGNQSSSIDQPDNYWHILIIDDEKSIHDITNLALRKLKIENRPIKLHSAFSAKEAKEILQGETEFCAAFVDVIMESDDAGLVLIDWIRNTLANHDIRLILRTGQAGSAPEHEVIEK